MRDHLSIRTVFFCCLLMGAVFVADISVPLGFSTGALYVAVIVIGLFSDSTRNTYVYATVCSGLILAGVYFYPVTVVSWDVVLVNRFIFIALVWCTAALIVRNQQARVLLREKDVALMQANHRLEQLANHDYLTGLPNRRQFSERLEVEYRRAVRERTDLSLLMIDVDFFKFYNDNLGHQAGDRCLVAIAEAIRAALRRPADLAARYGGEEFVVVLPNTELDGALEIAEAIRTGIASLTIAHPQSPAGEYVTVSLGLAAAGPLDGTGGPASLIEAADHALYEAKKQGRNRTVAAAVLTT